MIDQRHAIRWGALVRRVAALWARERVLTVAVGIAAGLGFTLGIALGHVEVPPAGTLPATGNAQALLAAGQRLQATGAYTTAIAAYSSAASSARLAEVALVAEAQCYGALGNPTSALAAANSAVSRAPRSWSPLLARAAIEKNAGLSALAVADARRAVALAPSTSVTAYTALQGMFFSLRDSFDALDVLSRALHTQPRSPFLYWLRGTTRASTGDLRGAMSDEEKAVALSTGAAHLVFLQSYGDLAARLSDASTASRVYRQEAAAARDYLRMVDPVDASVHIALAHALAAQNELPAAMRELARAATLASSSDDWITGLSQLATWAAQAGYTSLAMAARQAEVTAARARLLAAPNDVAIRQLLATALATLAVPGVAQ